MALIHLIRHGETDGNRSHYVGRRDLPLNTAGQAQADALAEQLSAFAIRSIFASPLLRARQTAGPLATRLGLPITVEAALIEIDFGDLQDLPKAGRALNLRKDHQIVPVPGGESLQDVWSRLSPFAAACLRDRPDDGGVAIVGHYWSIRLLRGLLSGSSFADCLHDRAFKPETGTVTAVSIPAEV